MTDIERATKWNKEHPERRSEISHRYNMTHKKFNKPETQRKHYLRSKYGISVEEYDAMLLAQEGKCAVCGKENSGIVRNGLPLRMYVDHDHVTKKVRGLLCEKCNAAIGLASESPEVLLKMHKYLTGV